MNRVVIGLLAGIAAGLFLGDRAAGLSVLADAYIKLLQMTVLPYITVALISGLGSLHWDDVRAIGARVGGVLVLLWTIGLAVVLLFPLIFPATSTASFFSTALLEPRRSFDLVSLYIPDNPFYSLANAIVPAVVLFSAIVGLALIAVPNKGRLLEVLQVANAAITRAATFIVRLAPYGVFVIATVAAGTLSLDDVLRLQVYIISYVAMSILLSLWILPGLVAALTPIPYRAMLKRSSNSLLTAVVTTSLLAVLPMLVEDAKALIEEHTRPSHRRDVLPDVIVPASFTFPHIGKIVSLSFVLFAAWFTGTTMTALDHMRLAGAGIPAMFGNVNLAVPFLLDLFRIPADTFQLFVATSVINAHVGTLMSATHTLVMALLGTCAAAGLLRFERRRIVRFTIVTVALTAAVVVTLHAGFALIPDHSYDKNHVLQRMHLLRDRGPAKVYAAGETAPPLAAPSGTVLDRVRGRKTLRVGYFSDSVPYAFANEGGELVGFDVDMAHQLARDLGVALEFVPVARAIDREVDPAECDLIMSGAVVVADGALRLLYSSAYLDETVAFLVLDHRRPEFLEWDSIRTIRPLRIGALRAPYYLRKIERELPEATLVPIERLDDMFAPHDPPIDAFALTAERGSAFALLHPEFSVAVPQPRPFKVPLAYIIAGRDRALADVVNTWIELKKKDGTIDELFAYWILGKSAGGRAPRWSVGHDVFGWW